MALAGLAPLSLGVVGAWRALEAARRGDRRARLGLSIAGGLAGAALAPWASPRGGTSRACSSAGLRSRRWRPRGGVRWGGSSPEAAALGASGGARRCSGAWWGSRGWLADARVLPRLYPAFHDAMLAATLLGAALVGIALGLAASLPPRARSAGAAVVWALIGVAMLATPRAARASSSRSGTCDVVLVEHGPMLGRRGRDRDCPPAGRGGRSGGARRVRRLGALRPIAARARLVRARRRPRLGRRSPRRSRVGSTGTPEPPRPISTRSRSRGRGSTRTTARRRTRRTRSRP